MPKNKKISVKTKKSCITSYYFIYYKYKSKKFDKQNFFNLRYVTLKMIYNFLCLLWGIFGNAIPILRVFNVEIIPRGIFHLFYANTCLLFIL